MRSCPRGSGTLTHSSMANDTLCVMEFVSRLSRVHPALGTTALPLSAHHVLSLLWLVRFWLLILHPLTPSPRLPFLASIRGDLGQQPTAMYIRRDGCRWAPAYLPSKSLPADLEGWLTSNRGTRSIHPRNLPGPYPSFNSALLNHHHPRHCPLPVSLCPLVSSIWSQTP